MKKSLVFAALAAAALALACQREAVIVTPQDLQTHDYRTVALDPPAPDPATKLSISEDDGKIHWEAGDKILIHGKLHAESQTVTLTAADITDGGRSAKITFDAGTMTGYDPHGYYALYPAEAAGKFISSTNANYYCEFTDTNKPLMGAYLDGTAFKFRNLCGIISFKVSGSYDSYSFSGNNEEVVGYNQFSIKRTADDTYTRTPSGPLTIITGNVTADGTTPNLICLPDGAKFPEGFSIILKNGGTAVKEARTGNSVNVGRNKLLPLGDITSRLVDYVKPAHHSAITGATALGASETANCYVITAPGSYKIPAVKGNSSTTVGTWAKAKLLWETCNDTGEVAQNSVIEAVDYDDDDNFVYFKTPASLKAGNALIAAVDEDGVILWSWHIWIPSTAIEDIANADFYNRKVMDRNLGALAAVPDAAAKPALSTYGLYYQWGRKDPFFTKDWGRNASSDLSFVSGTAVTTEQSIANPTTAYYLHVTGSGYNWNTEEITDLWDNSGKTVYDPCPAGYRVPAHDDSYAMWTYNSGAGWTSDASNGWFKYGSITFPYAGYASSMSLNYGGERAVIWSATYRDTERGWGGYFRSDKDPIYNYHSYYKPYLGSVRCTMIDGVVEPEPEPQVNADITIDGDMSDWAEVKGASSGNHGMFKVASDDTNIYFYSYRTTGGRYSQIWGEAAGYIYVAFNLDGDGTTGETLNGQGPYEFVGYFYPYGGTSDAPQIGITASGGCSPSSSAMDNLSLAGYTDENGAYVEFSIPRADLPEIPSTAIQVICWGNKDLSKVTLNCTL